MFNLSLYKAIIFDMDGVLVDSEDVILQAALAGLKEYDVTASPEDFTPFIGAGEDRYIGGVAQKYGKPYKIEMKTRVYDIYLTLVNTHIKVYSGTNTILQFFSEKGFVMGIGSSADRVKVNANLKAAKIPVSFFRKIFCGEDVERKKPFPDIYIQTAAALGINPSQCCVIEDAVNGIKAAKSAGMAACGITTSFTEGELLAAGADAVVSRIEDLQLFYFQ